MECNRAEAERAKEMADKKFDTKDYIGAKRLALKAQNLFPGLSGISQMLAVLEVYISAEKKINGEADWYGILGVDPTADDETLKKKYRKLALILHPDKNSSSGAEESFKLISDAWNLLADKAKRAAYDQKIRNVRLHSNVPSTLAPGNPIFTQRTNYSAANSQTTTTQEASFSTPAPPDKTNTFWTKCSNCSKKHDYPLIYLHQFLCCPDCRHTFLALDILAVHGSNQFTPSNSSEQRPKPKKETAANRGKSNTGRSSAAAVVSHSLYDLVGNSSSCSAAYTPIVDHMAQTAQPLHAFNKASGASTSRYDNNAAKRRCTDGAGVSRYGNNAKCHVDRGAGEASFEPFRGNATSNTMFTSNDISGRAAQNILKEKTKKKMNEGRSFHVAKTAAKKAEKGSVRGKTWGDSDQQYHNMPGTGQQGTFDMNESNSRLDRVNGIYNRTESITKEFTKKEMNEWGSSAALQMEKNGNERGQSSGNSDAQSDRNMSGRGKKVVETENIDTYDFKQSAPASGVSSEKAMTSTNVPDADFHNFDDNRTEKSFEENQVWAAYDEDDGMPRYYAKILGIISSSPFTMRISWLNSKTNKESPNWVSPGCSQTCGEFKVGKAVISENALNSFSHKVCWTKVSARIVGIYPKKGEIWAVYKNWSRDWNESTEDEVKHKYHIVEVVKDYNVKVGVIVTSLGKVTGFKSVYRQPLNPIPYTRRIPREQMCRFSHQVPAHFLTGKEAPNAPRGCWDLDPAAFSADLLKVNRNVKDEENVKIAENFIKDAKKSQDIVRES